MNVMDAEYTRSRSRKVYDVELGIIVRLHVLSWEYNNHGKEAPVLRRKLLIV